jgi:hypothetical protein
VALFTGKADRSLPIINKLYQLDGADEIEKFVGLYIDEEVSKERFGFVNSKGEEIINRKDINYRELEEFIVVLHSVMDEILNDKGTRETEKELHKFSNRYLSPPHLSFVNFTGGDEKTRPVVQYRDYGAESVASVNVSVKSIHTGIIRNALTGLFSAVERGIWGRCEECKSVFASAKKEVRYCSYRCRDRKDKRLRYRQTFEGYQGRPMV